tara:strand:- start:100 stop:1719 length:1620 start_codon:yes stop_codon:yes gene_type:complete
MNHFVDLGPIEYKIETRDVSIPLADIPQDISVFKECITYRDEEIIKVYDRKCDHNGGKLCLNEGKISCPMHNWEFNPQTGSYNNVKLKKEEINFDINDDNNLTFQTKKNILELPSSNIDHDLEITFFSHACILFKAKDFTFATDPWIEGFAFASGWWVNSLPPVDWVEKLNSLDFIYISHNHPDHLNEFTLDKISRDMKFIVPNFENKSVINMLNKMGFMDVHTLDMQNYFNYEGTDLNLAILPSGDFRDDSGLYFSYGNFSFLSSVDSNDLNFSRYPKDISVYAASFAGGASGYPLCFDTITADKKKEIVKRNTNSTKATVRSVIRLINPEYFLPYAGFFQENAERDNQIKILNIKNSTSDYKILPKACKLLDVMENDIFNFKGSNLIKNNILPREKFFKENPEELYKKEFSKFNYNQDFIFEYFSKSNYKDDLILYLSLTDSHFNETFNMIKVDFTKSKIEISFKEFNWFEIKDAHSTEDPNILHIKVRQDSFLWVVNKKMPWEDLSIGFQCRIDRSPDIYNVDFWYYFTNVYITKP